MRTSEQSLVIDNSKSGGSDQASHGQVKRESLIYSSQLEYFSLISPLILTGQSQQSAESFHDMQETSKASNKTQLTQPCVSLAGCIGFNLLGCFLNFT